MRSTEHAAPQRSSHATMLGAHALSSALRRKMTHPKAGAQLKEEEVR